MRQRDIPTTDAGAAFADRFVRGHSDRNLYFTPTLFKNTAGGKRTATQAAWTEWIWTDIDGVPGAETGAEAWAIVADLCDQLGLPQPNHVICTSEPYRVTPDGRRWGRCRRTEVTADPCPRCGVSGAMPGHAWWDLGDYAPRLQVYWRIEPLWVGDAEHRSMWKRIAGAVADALAAEGLKIDRGASTNLVGYVRLPGSIHQGTGTKVRSVGPQHGQLTTLTELAEAADATRPLSAPRYAARHRPSQRTAPSTSSGKRGKLMERPQMKALAQGVPESLRNLALYGLSKAMYADGWPFPQAVEWALDWNERCEPPEDAHKIRDVVARAFGVIGPESDAANFKGIDPTITAAAVEELTGEPTDPDETFRTWFPHPSERKPHWTPTESAHQINGKPVAQRKPKTKPTRGRARQTGYHAPNRRYTRTAVQVAKASDGKITMTDVAKAAGVSRQTISRRWDSIARGLELQLSVILKANGTGYDIIKIPKATIKRRAVNPNTAHSTMTFHGFAGAGRGESSEVSDRAPPGPSPPAVERVDRFVEQVRAELIGQGVAGDELERRLAEIRDSMECALRE